MFEEMVGRTLPVPDVVTGSTPVVAFGDPRTATVATLGIKPSWRQPPRVCPLIVVTNEIAGRWNREAAIAFASQAAINMVWLLSHLMKRR